MPVYEWQREKPLRVLPRVRVEEGDVFRAPEAVGRAFSDLLEEHEDTGQSADLEVRPGDNGGLEVDGPRAEPDTGGDAGGDAGAGAGGDTPDPTDLDEEEVLIDGEVREIGNVPEGVVGQDGLDLVEANVDEVTEEIESGRWDDRLGELEAAEAMNRDRVTVRRAIQERREALNG